jgi:hypothetical protein
VTNHSLTYAMGGSFTYQVYTPPVTAFALEEPLFSPFDVTIPPAPDVPTNAILASLFDDFSPLTITGTSGNDQIDNSPSGDTLGRIIGNIDLGGGNNGFHNFRGASMVGLESIDLGGGLFFNEGHMTNKGIGVVDAITVGGGFTQSSDGDFTTDIDLDNQVTDAMTLSGNGDFAGTAPLNFLSIDKLFTEYVLAKGASMVDSGITPTTLHPYAGFNFQTRVDNGTDLVLYADNPTFSDLAHDPASGVKDPGVYQMADYLDAIEGASSPDNPMARLINMVRMLPTTEEIGEALVRLTPHYAVHTFDMVNRSADILLDTARKCDPATDGNDGRCIWFNVSPDADYARDAGAGTTRRDDMLRTFSMGVLGEVGRSWSLGGVIGRTEFDSTISFNGERLSRTTGQSWQAYALGKYQNNHYFADFAVGGGTGSFSGERDTHLDQVAFVPGETLIGDYLPELLLPGIGNSVTYTQDSAIFGGSARLGYTAHWGGVYIQPSVQFDARWLQVSGKESGSVAAFEFDGSSNVYYAAMPGLEIGGDIRLGPNTSLGLYGNAGVQFSNVDWAIEGQFSAAKGLGAPPLHLTEALDSPLYRVGAGIELKGLNRVGLAVHYDGAFGENVRQHAISANLKIRF